MNISGHLPMFSLYFDQHTSDSQLLLSNGVDGFQ